MEKMREEFEIFMANPHWSWATGDMKEELYCLWKASRAALCVEVSEAYLQRHMMADYLVIAELDKAGVPYK